MIAGSQQHHRGICLFGHASCTEDATLYKTYWPKLARLHEPMRKGVVCRLAGLLVESSPLRYLAGCLWRTARLLDTQINGFTTAGMFSEMQTGWWPHALQVWVGDLAYRLSAGIFFGLAVWSSAHADASEAVGTW